MTGRSVVLLLIAASTLFAARNVGVGWLYALGYTLTATVAGSALFGAWALWGVRLTAMPAQKTQADTPLTIAVTLSNRGWLPRHYLSLVAAPLGSRGRLWPWRRALIPEGWGSLLIPELKPGERLTVQLHVPAPRRGLHPLPSLYLQAAPLGLVACFKALRPSRENRTRNPGNLIVVQPRIHPLRRFALRQRGRGKDEQDASQLPEAAGDVTKTVRPYRSGDAMRQIHWKTTARTGQLAVRESEGESPGEALSVVLDGVGLSPESFEVAVEVVASLLAEAREAGLEARLYHQTEAGLGLGPGVQTLENQLDWLAGLKAPEAPKGRAERVSPAGLAPREALPNAIAVTSRPEVWAGHADACLRITDETTIEPILEEWA